MGNSELSGHGGRRNWPVILAGCVGAGTGVALGLFVAYLADLHGFWSGLIAVCVLTCVGGALGRLAGSRLFLQPPIIGPHA
jgi:hypothetical protein